MFLCVIYVAKKQLTLEIAEVPKYLETISSTSFLGNSFAVDKNF